MTGIYKIPTIFQTISRALSVMVMILGLLFLTGANFLVYSDYHANNVCQQQDAQQGEAPNPVEEKSKSSNGGINIQEEYLHEKHSLKELAWLNDLLRHRIMDAEKLQIVHYELVSPPPKSC
jgi:hypothetical protein